MSLSSNKTGKQSGSQKIRKRSDRSFRALIENSFDVIVLQNAYGEIIYASPSITRILGYTPDEIIGTHCSQIVHPEDKQCCIETFTSLLATPDAQVTSCFRIRHKDGSWRLLEGVWKNLLSNPHVSAVVINLHDITAYQHMEDTHKKLIEQLDAERTLLKEILRQMPAGVVVADAKSGKIILNNEQVGQLIHSGTPPANIEQYAQGATYHLDGSPMQNHEWSLLRAITQGEVTFNEERLYVRKDGTQCYLNVNAAPIRDKDGEIVAAVVSFYDITSQKELEMRKNEFINMAGHELKTPLTSLKGFAYLLTRHIKGGQHDTEVLYFLTRMDAQINRLAQLINDLLDVSRIQTGKLEHRREVFALDELIKETVENMQGTTHTHSIIVEPLPTAYVRGDRNRIGQVVINLLSNAIRYSPKANKIIVSMTAENTVVTISIQDFGPGIAAEHHQHIFERFYQVGTTSPRSYPGLGIGLYISSQIAKQHQGHLEVKSEPGQGSTFSFTLPVMQE